MIRVLYILIILIIGMGFMPDPDPPQCVDGRGHVKHRYLYSLRDTALNYKFDTVYTELDTSEYLAIPVGFDSLFYRCMRCDSLTYDLSDTNRLHVRYLHLEAQNVWSDIVTAENPFKTNRIVFAGNIELLFDYEIDYYKSFNVCYSETDSYDDPTCDPLSDDKIYILKNKYYWLEIELKVYYTTRIDVYDNTDPENPILLQTINITYEE
jgi:hypothetical protein